MVFRESEFKLILGEYYLARFMLVTSMNPCQCGFLTDPDRECVCPAGAIQRYKSRLSGPLLDRIDMHVEVAPVSFEKLSERGESDESSRILERVMAARTIQKKRFADQPGIYANAQMEPEKSGPSARWTGPRPG